MKKITFFTLAAAGVVAYLLSRKKASTDISFPEESHHLTNAFSRAKQHALNH